MTVPTLLAIDHVHLLCRDRAASEAWYARVLGLSRIPELQHWAVGGGPLTLRDAKDLLRVALFERESVPHQPASVALRVSGKGFADWQRHLTQALSEAPRFEDHGLSQSLYFRDPDGNPWEITHYEVSEVA